MPLGKWIYEHMSMWPFLQLVVTQDWGFCSQIVLKSSSKLIPTFLSFVMSKESELCGVTYTFPSSLALRDNFGWDHIYKHLVRQILVNMCVSRGGHYNMAPADLGLYYASLSLSVLDTWKITTLKKKIILFWYYYFNKDRKINGKILPNELISKGHQPEMI